jgi:YD repeat-containing protein
MLPATAGIPQLMFRVHVQTNQLYSYDVGSRDAACAAFPGFHPPGTFELIGVKSDWPISTRYATQTTLINCQYKSIYGNPDDRAPGYAYCPVSNGASYVVDTLAQACACAPGSVYMADVDRCVAVTELPPTEESNPGTNGCRNCPDNKEQPEVGQPIDPSTGNMWHTETDYESSLPTFNLAVRRTYNSSQHSLDQGVKRAFGARWTHQYDVSIFGEASFSVSPGKCFRREDTKLIWCVGGNYVAQAMPDTASVVRPDGKRYYFSRLGLSWGARGMATDRLMATYNSEQTAILSWTYTTTNGDSTEHFEAGGKPLSITKKNGATLHFTYSNGISNDTAAGRLPVDSPVCPNVQAGGALPAGRLLCVTEQTGRQLQFEYDLAGRISKAIDPANEQYLYEYDGPSGGCVTFDVSNPSCQMGNLTKVTYPGGKSRTYIYNEAARINGGVPCPSEPISSWGMGPFPHSMTGLVDENEDRHISWTYNCFGKATSSEVGAGNEKVKLTYNSWTPYAAVVDHTIGTAASPKQTSSYLERVVVKGIPLNGTVNLPCAECGMYAQRTYDIFGSLASLKDWAGNYTCFEHESVRQLNTVKIDGGGGTSCVSMLAKTSMTPPMRKVSTQWHPVWSVPLAIAEPKKRTTFTYNANGALLTRTEQATTDLTGVQGMAAPATGSASTWTYTRNSLDQPLTATRPRTDLADTTTYSYDSQWNLSSMANALNHTTSFSQYDANGRVRRITAPNGVVTEMGYLPRGWLSWRSVSAGGVTETTSYSYDGVGQLTSVTLPSGATMTYTYDTAHRLTGVSDNLGNSVQYVLDYSGNRLEEKVLDPTGGLQKKIKRVFNTLNQMQQQTGGVQ